jgi:predicted HAD superfamily hydrolase
MSVKAASFDVFDTCLLRRCVAPGRVFEALGKRLQDEGRLPAGEHGLQDFVAARIRSEARALAMDAAKEPTLAAIWKHLSEEMGWDPSVELHHWELEQEDLELFANPEMLETVRNARRGGARVLFLSDMYLPGTFIRAQLVKHGFFEEVDRLYVSSEHRISKRNGGLFRLVLETERLHPSELSHVGDHPESDWRVPSGMGIHAAPYRAADLTRGELAMSEAGGSTVAHASRSFRLRKIAEPSDVTPLVSAFSGPFACLFANWILAEARKNGIERLYFFSRDCQIVWKVASVLAHKYGNIDCRYLKVSRQSLFLPSAEAVNPAAMPWMFREFEEPKLGKLLSKLEINPNEWGDHFAELHGGSGPDFAVSSQKDRDLFWNLLNQPPLSGALEEIRSSRRRSAVGYLRQNGLFDDARSGVVDLGWFASCQSALSKLLTREGRTSPIHGFYLGLNHGRHVSGPPNPFKQKVDLQPCNDP